MVKVVSLEEWSRSKTKFYENKKFLSYPVCWQCNGTNKAHETCKEMLVSASHTITTVL